MGAKKKTGDMKQCAYSHEPNEAVVIDGNKIISTLDLKSASNQVFEDKED